MASRRATEPGGDDVAIAASPGEHSSVAVASPPPPARHGYYSKQPRDDDEGAPAQQQQQQPRPSPPPMMGSSYPPATALHCLTSQPAVIDCPFCGNRVQTQVEDNDSHTTILSGIAIGFFCPCIACLPCCLGWFQDVDHYCPACQQRVAHVPHDLPAQVIVPAPGMMMMPLPPPPHHPQHLPYAAGPGYPPMQAAPAQQPSAPPRLARYA